MTNTTFTLQNFPCSFFLFNEGNKEIFCFLFLMKERRWNWDFYCLSDRYSTSITNTIERPIQIGWRLVEGALFFHSQASQWRKCEFFSFIFWKKKQVLLKSKSLPLKTIRVLQRILKICVKSKELSTASPDFRREQALAHSCFLMRRSLSRTNMST